MHDKRFLLIAYFFPPSGATAVHRPAKLVKYIGRHGWEPVVFTPTQSSDFYSDDTYLRELPPDLVVERAPTLEPSGRHLHSPAQGGGGGGRANLLRRLVHLVLFPDRHVLWLPTALPKVVAAARRHKVQAIMVTAPPFSSLLLAGWAARFTGLPLVLDFRDEWSGFYVTGMVPGAHHPLHQRLAQYWEARLVRAAAMVTTASPAYARRFQALYGGPAEKYQWIPNGFDPAEFPHPGPPPARRPGERLRLTYVGTVFEVTSLRYLWRGLALLSPDQRARIEVEVVGRVVAGERLDPHLDGLQVTQAGFLPHREAVARMAQAHGLLLTLSDMPGADRVIPSKVFEYLAARRPVLALVPPGQAANIVQAAAAGPVVHPGDPAGMARVLGEWLEKGPPEMAAPPEIFDRSRQAALMARVLDQAVGLR